MNSKKFFFLMQHQPTVQQVEAAREMGAEKIIAMCAAPEKPLAGVEYLGNNNLLNVPEDPSLDREWFLSRAKKILTAVGDMNPGDIVHAMGQYQLTFALNVLARQAGAELVESVTKRESVDKSLPDGSTKKVAIFRFIGYRPVYEF